MAAAQLVVLCCSLGYALRDGRALLPRREALQALGLAAATAPVWTARPAVAAAVAAPALRAAWTATDGFNDTSFIAFDEGAYAASASTNGSNSPPRYTSPLDKYFFAALEHCPPLDSHSSCCCV